MGVDFSRPVGQTPSNLLCLVIRATDKIRLLGANVEVLDRVTRVVRSGAVRCCHAFKQKSLASLTTNFFSREVTGRESITGTDRAGAVQFKLPGRPFWLQVGRDPSTLGKLLITRILEEMHALGYVVVCSADLARRWDNSTLFFTRGPELPARAPVLCVAPGSYDKVVVVKGDESAVASVRAALEESWPLGIQNFREPTTAYGRIHEFKLCGKPWMATGGQSAACRRTLLAIIANLGRLRWRLLVSTNLKGGTNTMFFIYDEGRHPYPDDLAILSLNREDRIRLINFDHSVQALIRNSITKEFQSVQPEEREFHGAYEFQLEGRPFYCSGHEAVASRRLISQILQDLASAGWDVLTTMDISRRLNDKSIFILKRSQPFFGAKFACVALTDVNHLRLVNFPDPVAEALREAVARGYQPGVDKEKVEGSSCRKMYLSGQPWDFKTGYSLHGRACLMSLLDEACRRGWFLKASADVSAKYVSSENAHYSLDVDSWWFCYFGE